MKHIAYLALLIFTIGCDEPMRTERSYHDGKVIQAAQTVDNSWAGLRCWAVIELVNGKQIAVGSPSRACLALTRIGQPVRIEHRVTRNGSEIWTQYWEIVE